MLVKKCISQEFGEFGGQVVRHNGLGCFL